MSDERTTSALRTLVLISGLVLLAFGAGGCSEEPTETNALNAALPLKEVVVRDTTIMATAANSYRLYVTKNDVVNMVGKSGEYTAVAALQFAGFPLRDTARVFSATVTLRCLTWAGDSTADLAVNVYRITRAWGESNATWDTLQANLYDGGKLVGRFSSPAGKDTQTVTFDIDTAMVRQWLATGTDSTNTKYGIVLVPDASTRILRGFNAFGYDSSRFSPTLTIIAGSVDGVNRDTASFTSGYDTFFGNIDNLNSSSGLLYAQCGVDYRSSLTFDVSFISRGAIINRADLYLKRDPATTRLTRFSDSTFMIMASLSAGDNTQLDASYAVGSRMADSANTFHADARRAAQLWVHGQNYGLSILPSLIDHRRSLDLLTFRSPTAPNTADRPRLRITYTTAR